MRQRFDKIIIGAGLYGLYAAEYSGKKGENILVLEYDTAPFQRATYINQARVHMGYHYPRSLTTAIKFLFAFMINLNRYMQHLINFLGQMQNSLWIFAEQRIFAVMKWRLQDILKKECAMELF